MTNNNTQTVTISVARYKQLEGLLEKARGRAWTYEQANDVLAARVAELEAELEARLSVEASASLQARVAELEKLALYLDKQSDAKTALIGQIIDDLAKKKEEFEALKNRRVANLKWIKNLVHSAWMLAEREGAGEEALEELVHIRDLINYTVANMLQDDK